MSLEKKLNRLRRILRDQDGLVVAFSGGVDSTFLAAVAVETLGKRCLAVTATSPTYPVRELKEAKRLARLVGIRHRVVDSNELKIPGFSANPPDRCYHCKRELFSVLRRVADGLGYKAVADGTDADDRQDYRPGRRAAQEAGVISPLLMAGLGRDAIRELSRRCGLPTADKPSFACLASRFPYGSTISATKLRSVDKVESYLLDLGFKQVRVRHHGNLARIEVDPSEMGRLCTVAYRDRVCRVARQAGFTYVSVDLEGYQTGRMNRELPPARRARNR